MDKANAIADYLRSDEFTYSQDIEAPPRDADGVDHFLFETKTGYSDYFASTMVVLMRAVGVPTRLAAGYAPGEYDAENDVRVVRDFDSHGWVQVFFPEYGWIDFEPTPQWPVHVRRMTTGPGADLLPTGGSGGMSGDTSEFLDPFNEIGLPGAGGLASDSRFQGTFSLDALLSIAARGGIVLGAIGGVWLLLYWIWNAGLRGLSPVERAYAKMNRMGALAGMRRGAYQTPNEYAAMLAGALDDAGASAQRIGAAFGALRYTGAGAASDTDNGADDSAQTQIADDMEQAWRSIRGALLTRAFRRLLPGGN